MASMPAIVLAAAFLACILPAGCATAQREMFPPEAGAAVFAGVIIAAERPIDVPSGTRIGNTTVVVAASLDDGGIANETGELGDYFGGLLIHETPRLDPDLSASDLFLLAHEHRHRMAGAIAAGLQNRTIEVTNPTLVVLDRSRHALDGPLASSLDAIEEVEFFNETIRVGTANAYSLTVAWCDARTCSILKDILRGTYLVALMNEANFFQTEAVAGATVRWIEASTRTTSMPPRDANRFADLLSKTRVLISRSYSLLQPSGELDQVAIVLPGHMQAALVDRRARMDAAFQVRFDTLRDQIQVNEDRLARAQQVFTAEESMADANRNMLIAATGLITGAFFSLLGWLRAQPSKRAPPKGQGSRRGRARGDGSHLGRASWGRLVRLRRMGRRTPENPQIFK